MTTALAPPLADEAEADPAIDQLDALLDGFEFEAPLDRSVALAALLTVVTRPRLRTAPLFVGNLRRLAGIAAALSGRPLATLHLSGAAASADVAIRSVLTDHPPVLLLDCTWWTGSPLGGPHLTSTLAGHALARVPGTTRVEPLRTTIFVVGPEPAITKEIAGSVLVCRMSDPGFDPVARATAHRGHYADAAEAIAGHGDDWERAVRERLVDLGLPDPAEALGRLRVDRTWR